MIVLDTQVWLWWLHDPKRLGRKALAAVQGGVRGDGLCVSAISVWEVAVKAQLGKLTLPLPVETWYEQASRYPGIGIEPLLPEDAIQSTLLPGNFHKDPADRIIIALARRLSAILVTADARIRAYPHVKCIW